MREYNPKTIRIFSRGELLQQDMRQRFSDDKRLRFFIGDVRDRDRLYRAMSGVDIVVHAAALKQVPTCENIRIVFGLYSRKAISVNFCPKEPVPPVTNITLF